MDAASKTSTQDPAMNELGVISVSPSSKIVREEGVDALSGFKGESSSSASQEKPSGAEDTSFSKQNYPASRNQEFLEDDSRNEVARSEIDELISVKNQYKDENFNEFMTQNLESSGVIYVERKEREGSEKKTEEGAVACSGVVSDQIKEDSECKTVDESYSNAPKPGCSKELSRNSLASLNDFSFKSEMGNTPNFKRGIVFSSTPLSVVPSAKRRKLGTDNLSAIREEVESGETSEDSNTPPLTDEIKEQSPVESTFSNSCKAHRPLTKDEISMVFDLPDGPLNQNENNAVEKNDVTIKLNNGQSIVYADVKDKTIDEVILNGEHEIDLIKLEREPDKSRILQKAKELKVFISENDQENKDNFDPEWEAMRKLETDDERYKAVRKLWMNLNIPDPKENLSSFNWRKRNNLGPPSCNPIEDINCLASKGTFPCTEVFDVANKKLVDLYEKRMRGFAVDGNYERAVLNSRKRSHPNAMNEGNGQFLEQLYECVQEKICNNERAKQEIEAIHKFYNGLRNRSENSNNLMRLTYRERQEILDVEDIITSYSHWYKC